MAINDSGKILLEGFRVGGTVKSSNGNDIEAKRNEASILRHFFYRSETNKLILKL